MPRADRKDHMKQIHRHQWGLRSLCLATAGVSTTLVLGLWGLSSGGLAAAGPTSALSQRGSSATVAQPGGAPTGTSVFGCGRPDICRPARVDAAQDNGSHRYRGGVVGLCDDLNDCRAVEVHHFHGPKAYRVTTSQSPRPVTQ